MNPETLNRRIAKPGDGAPIGNPQGGNPGSIPTAPAPIPPARRLTSNPPPQRSHVGRFIFWTLLIVGLVIVGIVIARRIQQSQSAAAAGRVPRLVPPVVVAEARIGDVPVYLDEPGTVFAFNTVTVHSRVDGQLILVAFKEGQIVKEHDLLAEIDPKPFEAILTQAQGQLARDQALLENANLDLKRYQDAPPDTFTPQQVDTQKALVDQYGGTVETDRGTVSSAQVNLDYCKITAQVTGRIGLRNVDQGNIVHASDATGLAVITQLQPINVVFSIVQDDIARVMKSSPTVPPLEVTALDQDMNLHKVLAHGTLAAIDSEVATGTNRVKLKAQFENTDFALFPGEFVNARLLVETRKNMILVPSTAIQHGPDSSPFVYLVGPENKVEMRVVTLGVDDGDLASVASGLLAGDVVVTDGVDKLQPGVTVVVHQATTQPSGSTRPSGMRGSGRRGGNGGGGGAGSGQ